MTVALPALPCHAGGGHLFADFADPTRTPRPVQSSCFLPSPLQPDMTECFERDGMPPALKSPCPPTSSNNNTGSSSPEIDLKPFKIGPPPSMQRHPGVLRLSLQSGVVDIPPAFYPGVTIPLQLGLELRDPRRVGTLKLNLIGTLRTPHTTRVVVNIVTDLPSGAANWVREGGDDISTPSSSTYDADIILPGRWSQSVQVQIPRQSVLPPSVSVMWEMSYRFRLVLCPADRSWRPVGDFDLSGCLAAERAVEILPATLPEPAPMLFPYTFWIARPRSLATDPWTAHLSLPTTTFGPTSVIPVSLRLVCPPSHHAIALTLSLVREEMVTTRVGPGSSSENQWTTVALTRRLLRPSDGEVRAFVPLDLRAAELTPSSSIEVGPADKMEEDDDEYLWTSVSSNAGLKVKCEYRLCVQLEFGTGSKHIFIPIIIGSVGEPRDAVRQYEWSELYFPPTNPSSPSSLTTPAHGHQQTYEHVPTRRRAGEGSLHPVGDNNEPSPVLIWGTEEGSEDGWLVPPPSYGEALEVVPYIYDPTV